MSEESICGEGFATACSNLERASLRREPDRLGRGVTFSGVGGGVRIVSP